MPVTDLPGKVIAAIVAILNADAGIQALTGRATKSVVKWGTVARGMPQPLLEWQFITAPNVGGTGDTRKVAVQITATAAGEGGQGICYSLIERVEEALTHNALTAQGLDAAPLDNEWRRYDGPIDPEGGAGLARADLDVIILATK